MLFTIWEQVSDLETVVMANSGEAIRFGLYQGQGCTMARFRLQRIRTQDHRRVGCCANVRWKALALGFHLRYYLACQVTIVASYNGSSKPGKVVLDGGWSSHTQEASTLDTISKEETGPCLDVSACTCTSMCRKHSSLNWPGIYNPDSLRL